MSLPERSSPLALQLGLEGKPVAIVPVLADEDQPQTTVELPVESINQSRVALLALLTDGVPGLTVPDVLSKVSPLVTASFDLSQVVSDLYS